MYLLLFGENHSSFKWMPAGRRSAVMGFLWIALLGCDAQRNSTTSRSPRTNGQAASISGFVLGKNGPIPNARVRVQGQADFVLSDRDGRFVLSAPASERAVITAAKPGYLIEGATVADELKITLRRLPEEDDEHYQWTDPRPDAGGGENCGNCHQQIFDEWQESEHAHTVTNRRFLSMMDGTDWEGAPGHGWSLKADYPNAEAVCSACHAPTHDAISLDAWPTHDSVAGQGVHCDFCHKIQEVPANGVGFAHGRLGVDLLRSQTQMVIFGPLDDVDRGFESYSPLQSESRYCAACHEGVLLGVHVYSTYSEWLDSPARQQGKDCQSCHMKPTGKMTDFAPDMGGIARDPATLASHTFMPGGRLTMLKKCVSEKIAVERADGHVRVDVELAANDVGHRVPTGFVDRHLVLVVLARDHEGNPLNPLQGPVLPSWFHSDSGLAGLLFAKQLADEDGNMPVPFWSEGANIRADTRLISGQLHQSTFLFPVETTQVQIMLRYRRTWEFVAEVKKWPENDIVVFDRTIHVD